MANHTSTPSSSPLLLKTKTKTPTLSHSKAIPSSPIATTGTSVPMANEPGASKVGAALPVGVVVPPVIVIVMEGEAEPVPEGDVSPPDEVWTNLESFESSTKEAWTLLFLQSDPGFPVPETKLTDAHYGLRH